MEDKYYYKLRSIQAELDYLRTESDESDNGIITSEAKKKLCRVLLASILLNTKAIQAKLGKEFIPEFKDD